MPGAILISGLGMGYGKMEKANQIENFSAANACDATNAFQNEYFNEFDSRTSFSFTAAPEPAPSNVGQELDFGSVGALYSNMDSFSSSKNSKNN